MQQKSEWLDFIKVFAIFSTLLLHSNSTLVNFQTSIVKYPVELNMFYWDIGVVFASLAGPSFALIFMYLGAITLGTKHSSFSFYLSKAKLLLIPLIFWSLFAFFFQRYLMHQDINIIPWFLSIIKTVVTSAPIFLLLLLIIVFLLTPFLKKYITTRNMMQQFIIATIWMLCITFLLTLERSLGFKIPMLILMAIAYLGFMQFGFLLSRITLRKNILLIATIFFLIGNAWTIFGSIHYSNPEDIAKGIYANYYFSRISVPMILNSLGIFVLLRYVAEKTMQTKWFYNKIIIISRVALGMCMVYSYWFVVLGTEKIGIELTAFSGNPLWSVPLTALATILGSFLTVSIIKKIPYFHHVTPKLY